MSCREIAFEELALYTPNSCRSAEIDIMNFGNFTDLPSPRARRKTQRVTMTDVANRAAVSPSTVSLFLRRPAAVTATTGQAIAQAIEDLGYLPNFVAGGLAAASSRAVSVVVPSVRNAFFAETVEMLQVELGKERLQVLLGHSDYSEREEESLVRTALSWSPAAVVLTGTSHSDGTRKILGSAGVPVVEIWELGGSPIDMVVGFSHEKIGGLAAQHLIERNCKRIAFLGARMQEDRRASYRAAGFLKTAQAVDSVRAEIINNPARANVEIGGVLLGQALEQVSDLDGIACSNDHLALGVIFECQRRGISIPEQLALIGFGDLDFSGSCNPALTTIRPSGDIIGRETARLIISAIAGDETVRGSVVDTHFQLIKRQSA